MKFLDEWRTLLARAWSIRLDIFAALLDFADVMCSAFITNPPFDRVWFSVVAGLVSAAALIARLMAQNNLSGASK